MQSLETQIQDQGSFADPRSQLKRARGHACWTVEVLLTTPQAACLQPHRLRSVWSKLVGAASRKTLFQASSCPSYSQQVTERLESFAKGRQKKSSCNFLIRLAKELLDGQESLRYELRQVKMQVRGLSALKSQQPAVVTKLSMIPSTVFMISEVHVGGLCQALVGARSHRHHRNLNVLPHSHILGQSLQATAPHKVRCSGSLDA